MNVVRQNFVRLVVVNLLNSQQALTNIQFLVAWPSTSKQDFCVEGHLREETKMEIE
jgi:hypothetical protein